MSAVNVFLDPERAIVLTDGATYQDDGTLVSLGRKCWPVKGCKAIVTGRGPAWFAPSLARTLPDYMSSIDEFEIAGEYWIDRCIEASQEKGILGPDPAIDIFVVGWSVAEGKAKCFQFTTVPPAGVSRFQSVDSVVSPGIGSDAEAAVAARVGPQQAGSVNYDRLGIELMEEQRRKQGEIFAPGQFLVGGHVLRTEITAKGVTQREIHHWHEDKIGQKIRPSPRLDPTAHPNVTALPMNRADRRRLEKAQRKGAA